MALLKKLVSSAVSQSGNISNEALLWPNVENFCCHREDEVFLHGGITGDPVPPFACQFSPGVDTYMHKCNSIHIHYISLEIPYSHILAVADEEGITAAPQYKEVCCTITCQRTCNSFQCYFRYNLEARRGANCELQY
ncbi:hypothetical protein GBAR_LOCUS55 [Geodia barretti]|uniref:Uncharacterized protein n=1 Tax=Geodia barretti TaxID=519541 RepID=A0AA35VX64_GEOBA|nr:hypothetical protein GBAR_LOCUS55 [Geodia barretti]